MLTHSSCSFITCRPYVSFAAAVKATLHGCFSHYSLGCFSHYWLGVLRLQVTPCRIILMVLHSRTQCCTRTPFTFPTRSSLVATHGCKALQPSCPYQATPLSPVESSSNLMANPGCKALHPSPPWPPPLLLLQLIVTPPQLAALKHRQPCLALVLCWTTLRSVTLSLTLRMDCLPCSHPLLMCSATELTTPSLLLLEICLTV